MPSDESNVEENEGMGLESFRMKKLSLYLNPLPLTLRPSKTCSLHNTCQFPILRYLSYGNTWLSIQVFFCILMRLNKLSTYGPINTKTGSITFSKRNRRQLKLEPSLDYLFKFWLRIIDSRGLLSTLIRSH